MPLYLFIYYLIYYGLFFGFNWLKHDILIFGPIKDILKCASLCPPKTEDDADDTANKSGDSFKAMPTDKQ